MSNLIMFSIFSVVILGSAVLCVTTRRIMRAATFLLFVLLGIAGLYFLLDYTYLGAAQIAIYAGGITILYIFTIPLVSKQSLHGVKEKISKTRFLLGSLMALVGFLTVVFVLLKNRFINNFAQILDEELPMEKIGTALLGADKYQYILPFEFISVFLLACIIGGLMIARKEEKN